MDDRLEETRVTSDSSVLSDQPIDGSQSRKEQGPRLRALLPRGVRKHHGGDTLIPRWLVSVVVGLTAWELAVRIFDPNPLIVVGPSAIWRELIRMVTGGTLWPHVVVSMKAFTAGYAASAVLGIALGLVMGSSRRVREYLDPWVSALYATPSIALAPLFIVWLGFGSSSKIAIVALLTFFPIIINTLAGALAIDRDLREVGLAYRASRWEMFALVMFPGSMGYILTGLKLAIGRGLVGVVVADLFGSSAGLGYLILNSATSFNTARIFVATIVLAVLGVGLTSVVESIQRRFAPWTLAG